MPDDDLEEIFAHHPPDTPGREALHQAVRAHCLNMAQFLRDHVPASDERKVAINHLRDVMHWANAAVALAPADPGSFFASGPPSGG